MQSTTLGAPSALLKAIYSYQVPHQSRMPILAFTVALFSASLLADETKAMLCTVGQEPDPTSYGRYRWVIPVEDPCRCTEVRSGAVTTRKPPRAFKVTYRDTCLFSSNPAEIRQWLNCSELLSSCRAYMEAGLSNGSGIYAIKPQCNDPSIGPLTVYCDQNSNGGGWMRFYQKTGPSTCSTYDFTWTAQLITCLGLDTKITGFAVSDDVTTINREGSWILNDSSWSFDTFRKCLNPSCSESKKLDIPNADVIANLANCKTPTGTVWSQEYGGSFAQIQGIFYTNGNWEQMFTGCHNQFKRIGDGISFRFGGALGHTGEFVHVGCNDYTSNPANRITSRWESNDVRAIWIKTK